MIRSDCIDKKIRLAVQALWVWRYGQVSQEGRAGRYFFYVIVQQNLEAMQFQYESLSRDTPSYADSKFHNQSLTTALYHTDEPHSLLPHPTHHGEKYAVQLASTAAYFPCDDPEDCLPIERQILQITHRFGRIQQVLLEHSARESRRHEKVYGLKELPIDWTQLSPDLTNKINIVEDLRHLVAVVEQQPTPDIAESLESKFQEYYLERHYGGLKCQINDLSIQERDEETAPIEQRKQIDYQSMAFGYAQESSGYQQQSVDSRRSSFGHLRPLQGLSSFQRSQESLEYINLKEEKRPAVSRIGGIASLVNQSQMSYTEDCCQTVEENYSISVEVPRIIEVEIPLIVYRVKEKVITYDESDLEAPYNDIDEIIDKYSRPYEQLYLDSDKNIRFAEEASPSLQSVMPRNDLQVGSILLDSHVDGMGKEMTEVQLTYSHLPEEQLMLESFAQIGSLVSNTDSPTIVITQKLNSRSILEKFQESERILNQENMQLKEEVSQLKQSLQETEKKLKEATAMGKKLSDRLQEQIQQGVYLAKKLDELDAELLEEKVDCLTRLNQCKDNKIATLQADLAQQVQLIQSLRTQIGEMKAESEKKEELLITRDQEVAQLNRQLEEKEQQLRELTNCEDDIIQIVSQTEISLKEEIEKLQQDKTLMKEQIKQFQKRVESEGFNLQYEEAKEIQGIIEAREHIFNVQLKEATDKYEGIITMYKQELEQTRNELTETRVQLGEVRIQLGEARQQVKILNELNQAKSELHDTCTTVKQKRLSDSYINQFQALIEQYDRELQLKDEDILSLKQQLLQVPVIMQKYEEQCLIKFRSIIDGLNEQLQKERQERFRVASRLVEVDRMLADSAKALQSNELDKYQTLVEQLTDRLEKVMSENSNLKEGLAQMRKRQLDGDSQQLSVLRKEVQKLRRVNGKLKKYTVEMESQLISISGMSRCESHKHIIASLTEQRNYLADQLTKG